MIAAVTPPALVAAVTPPALVAAGVATTDIAFYPVFAVFVIAFAVLAVVSVRWAVRRDRAGRAEWARRHEGAPGDVARGPAGRTAPVAPSQTNGHASRRPGHKGRERKPPG